VVFSFVSLDKNFVYTSYLFINNIYSANQFFLDIAVRILFYRDITKTCFCFFVQICLCLSVCMSYDWQTIAILLDLTAHRFNRCAKIQKISRNPTLGFTRLRFLNRYVRSNHWRKSCFVLVNFHVSAFRDTTDTQHWHYPIHNTPFRKRLQWSTALTGPAHKSTTAITGNFNITHAKKS
jgi:hypothetical protein